MTFNWLGKTILVAEDEPANFLFIEKVLETTKVKLIRAHNGQEAIEVVKQNSSIDLVLMDIYMPDTDGFEATKRIKELFPKLPVIAQTCYDGVIDPIKIEEAGFDNFVRKPININKLLAIIEKYINSVLFVNANAI